MPDTERTKRVNAAMRGTEFMDALQMQQEAMRLNAMRNDPEMRRSWKAYQKMTRKLPANSRLTQDQFFMNIYRMEGYDKGQGTRATARHEG